MTTLFTLKSVINFGTTFNGCTVEDILHDQPEYLKWCYENIHWFDMDLELTEALSEALNPTPKHLRPPK